MSNLFAEQVGHNTIDGVFLQFGFALGSGFCNKVKMRLTPETSGFNSLTSY